MPYLTNTDRILDIGCSKGGLLAKFKRRGFSNLLGVDPSPACDKFTVELYGITAKPATISTEPENFQAIDREWQWRNPVHRLCHN